jgi:hypothetical protein
MNSIRRYGSTSTDLLLARALENAGDRDPSKVLADTGRPLHFDATDALPVHLDAAHPTTHDAEVTLAKVIGAKIGGASGYEKAVHATELLFSRSGLRMAIGVGLEGLSAIATLGSLYKEAIEDARNEGDKRLALGASDAGIVGMVEALDVDPAFKAAVGTAHAGSWNAAATVAVQIGGDLPMRTELQFRADQGFVDAAGYAKLAAKELGPLYRDAASKLTTASRVASELPASSEP